MIRMEELEKVRKDVDKTEGKKIIRQMQEAESVTDELKENDQMAWIKAMNSIHNRAEEIVL